MLGAGDMSYVHIERKILLSGLQRGLANVKTEDGFCASPRRVERESAGIGEYIQNPFAVSNPPDFGAVIAVIEEEAGLMSVNDIRRESQSVFHENYWLGEGIAMQKLSGG
jgi:hypothetical protein